MAERHFYVGIISDLGTRDPALAQFKASVLDVNPSVYFLDVTHEIKSRDLLEAAFKGHGKPAIRIYGGAGSDAFRATNGGRGVRFSQDGAPAKRAYDKPPEE